MQNFIKVILENLSDANYLSSSKFLLVSIEDASGVTGKKFLIPEVDGASSIITTSGLLVGGFCGLKYEFIFDLDLPPMGSLFLSYRTNSFSLSSSSRYFFLSSQSNYFHNLLPFDYNVFLDECGDFKASRKA